MDLPVVDLKSASSLSFEVESVDLTAVDLRLVLLEESKNQTPTYKGSP